jgi:hypothetical protein
MGRSQIRCTIHRPLKEVFDVYTQPDTWGWSDMRNARWYSGKPWEVESRMRMEPSDSFGVVVDQVLTHFEPYRRVDFISHFGGVTLTSQIYFRALSDTVTEVRSELEFVGTFSRIAGFTLGPAIDGGTRRFYEQLKRECEREAAGQSNDSESLPNPTEVRSPVEDENR